MTHDFFVADSFEGGGSASVTTGALLAVGSGPPYASTGLDLLDNGIFDELLTNAGLTVRSMWRAGRV